MAHARAGRGAGGLRRFEVAYLGREGRSKRVIVPVTLNGRVTLPMALDTGSPGLIISFALAEKLDLFSRDDGALIVAAASEQLSDQFAGLVGMDFLSQCAMSIEPGRQRVVLQEQDLAPELPGGHPESWWRDNFAEFRALRDAWKAYLALVEQRLASGSSDGRLLQLKEIALRQMKEAEKLYDRLDRFASREAVPRQWR